MDPLSALSLAGNVVQFVDFGYKLVSNSRDFYKSSHGALEAHVQLELITSDLRAFLDKLKQRPALKLSGPQTRKETKWEADFDGICNHAGKVAEELVARLEGLRVKGAGHRRWESLQMAVRSAWRRNEIERLKEELSELRDVLETRLMLSIRESLDTHALCVSDRFKSLDRQTQLIIISLLDTGKMVKNMSDELRDQINSQTMALTQIISRLNAINEDEPRKTREMIMNASYDERYLQNGEVIAEVEILAVSDTQESKLRSAISMRIAEALAYQSMRHRYEDVVDAYPNTFEWAFSAPTARQLPWSNLSQWLVQGDGVYWINGKAGSGKTTLMKHIFDDGRTHKYLAEWSGDDPLCVATFYFWNSGSREQRSQAGLLRSILFQILEACPELAPIIMPQVWASAYSKCLKGGQMLMHSMEPWPLRTLMAAFKSFIEQREIPLKTCLLVDGLDEFDGDHEEIAYLFKEIAHSHNVKVCLSSRPLVIFREAFSSCPSLRLQDLTFLDIQHFVSGRFDQNESFRRLADREPKNASVLVEETVNKADGVFLWVQILVRSLLNGIRNRDSIHELLIRLRELPKEIEALYQHLLARIEPVYLQWASKAVQLLRLFHRLSINRTMEYLNVRRFYFAISQNFEFSDVETIPSEAITEGCEDIEIQLAARCAGLIEIGRHSNQEEAPIKWFHRTARDFIEQTPFGLALLDRSSSPELNPGVLMMKAHILDLMIQIRRSPQEARKMIQPLVNSCLIYAEDADPIAETHPAQINLLDQMDRFLATNCSGREHWMVPFIPKSSVQSLPVFQVTFLHIATVHNLTGYVGAKVPFEAPRRYNPLALSLLRFKVPSLEMDEYRPESHDVHMIHLLEELGATIEPGEYRDDRKKKKRGYWLLPWSLW